MNFCYDNFEASQNTFKLGFIKFAIKQLHINWTTMNNLVKKQILFGFNCSPGLTNIKECFSFLIHHPNLKNFETKMEKKV